MNSCANNAHNSGLKKKKKNYMTVRVWKLAKILTIYLCLIVLILYQSIYRGHNLSYITITFIVYLCH